MQTEILYEDNDIMIIYKPAGLAAQTARLGQPDVVSELKNYLARSGGKDIPIKKPPYLGVIHRLDQPVEGVMIFAKNKKAASLLGKQLAGQGEESGFCKHYYAVVCGRPGTKEGRLTDYLYKNQENRAVIVEALQADQDKQADQGRRGNTGRQGNPALQGVPAGQQAARKAVLRYRILELLEAQGLALAEICIETGRFHQIRAQMAHAGMPLLGDLKYGNEETKQMARALGVPYVALCACRLECIHPVSGKRISINAKPRNRAFSFFSQL